MLEKTWGARKTGLYTVIMCGDILDPRAPFPSVRCAKVRSPGHEEGVGIIVALK